MGLGALGSGLFYTIRSRFFSLDPFRFVRGTLVIFVSLGCLVHLLGPNLGSVFVISLLVLFEPFSLFCDRVRFGTERHWYGTLRRQLCCLVLSDRM